MFDEMQLLMAECTTGPTPPTSTAELCWGPDSSEWPESSATPTKLAASTRSTGANFVVPRSQRRYRETQLRRFQEPSGVRNYEPMNADELFWECASELLAIDGVVESTMFGFRCLRVGSEFVGMPADNQLWVKLHEERVNELIDSGVGSVCAPSGRPFREWVSVSERSRERWLELLEESIEFVRNE